MSKVAIMQESQRWNQMPKWRILSQWYAYIIQPMQWLCMWPYWGVKAAIQAVAMYFTAKTETPLPKQRPWCPSEKAAWARLRLTLHAPLQPEYRAPDPPRFKVLNDIIPRCLSIKGAPMKLVVLPPLTPVVPECLEREKALWVLQLDMIKLDHTSLVRLLLFANCPGSMLIVLTRDTTVTCVAAQCGFKTVWAQPLSNITPAAIAEDNMHVLLWVRESAAPFVRGTGACIRSPRLARTRRSIITQPFSFSDGSD